MRASERQRASGHQRPAWPGNAVRQQRRVVEIDTPEEFAAAVAAGDVAMDGWRVRGLDLRSQTATLLHRDPAGSLFLGCTFEAAAREHLLDGGALVFPEVPGAPIDPYRGELYTADELYAGLRTNGYAETPDARAYAWSQRRSAGTADIVVRALHDAAIEAALDTKLAASARRVVGVMGGHGLRRGGRAYRQAARLGRRLATAGMVVATGGGPGAMEAANLGATFAAASDVDLDAAVDLLAAVPSFKPSVDAWARAALDVRERWPGGDGGLAVPTWFYGHEPPNLFASGIAKLFQNSVREATLLNRCTGGIVFLPGAAGTVQEIFQDACENFYAAPASVTPMVLVDSRHWTESLPVWPLLSSLAADRGFAASVVLVEDVDAAADFVSGAAADT
jgi:predicted Rossmann-fold nucleotide-binding protein